jgi:hypothetical protein
MLQVVVLVASVLFVVVGLVSLVNAWIVDFVERRSDARRAEFSSYLSGKPIYSRSYKGVSVEAANLADKARRLGCREARELRELSNWAHMKALGWHDMAERRFCLGDEAFNKFVRYS